MKDAEALLKEQLKTGPAGAYLLYGEEPYLVDTYARQIARVITPDPTDVFNYQQLDGEETTPEQLAQAVTALPLLADKLCVSVRDMDLGAHSEAIVALLQELPDSTVLVFRQVNRQPDRRKKGWQAVLKQLDAAGLAVAFPRRNPAQLQKILIAGAKHRGCRLDAAGATLLAEQAGNDLYLLSGELDKLAALATDGVITQEQIRQAGTKNLEVRVFQLSRAILAGRSGEVYELLHQLAVQREEPLAILGTLSTAYADLYRAKTAALSGISTGELAADFPSYKGKEFRLQNAARDCRRLELSALRRSLDILAQADTALKTGAGQERLVLEQTAARLMQCAGAEAAPRL